MFGASEPVVPTPIRYAATLLVPRVAKSPWAVETGSCTQGMCMTFQHGSKSQSLGRLSTIHSIRQDHCIDVMHEIPSDFLSLVNSTDNTSTSTTGTILVTIVNIILVVSSVCIISFLLAAYLLQLRAPRLRKSDTYRFTSYPQQFSLWAQWSLAHLCHHPNRSHYPFPMLLGKLSVFHS